jgi:hypothetical protein
MKNRGQNNELQQNKKKTFKENPTQQYRAPVQKATPANEHNSSYQISKTEVPQHQQQYVNSISQQYTRCTLTHCKGKHLHGLMFKHSL